MLTDLIVGSKGIKTRGLRRFVSMLALVIMVITFISGTIGVDAAKAVTYGPTFASSASAVLLDGNTVSFTAVFPSVAPSDDGLRTVGSLSYRSVRTNSILICGKLIKIKQPVITRRH